MCQTQEIAVEAANNTNIIHHIGASTNTVDNGKVGIDAATLGFVT